MIKLCRKIAILVGIFILINISTVSAFSDDLFSFDLPETYGHVSYQTAYIFSDTENENRGMVIYAQKDIGLKKSVWDVEQKDLNTIIERYSDASTVIETDKRARLGKEKAIRVVLKDGNDYMELYMLGSNNYVYIVTFVGNSEEELNNEDYQMIKDSFKLKDGFTNPNLIYLGAFVIGIVIWGIKMYLKNKNSSPMNYSYNQTNYKDLTEEDFKKFQKKN